MFGAAVEHLDSYLGTLYFEQLSYCRNTHFKCDRLILDCLEHIIVLTVSLVVSCKTFPSGQTTYL